MIRILLLITAIKLIDKASEAKVDAVKFQSYDTQSYLSSEIDKARIKRLDKFSLDFISERCTYLFTSLTASTTTMPKIPFLSVGAGLCSPITLTIPTICFSSSASVVYY